MVRPLADRHNVFLCEECGFGYADRRTAESCEAYCRAHHSCSMTITANAVYRPEDA